MTKNLNVTTLQINKFGNGGKLGCRLTESSEVICSNMVKTLISGEYIYS